MNKKKPVFILYFLAAAGFYIAAVIGFVNDGSVPTIWLCLGSAMLCFGAGAMNTARKETAQQQEEQQQEEPHKEN